MWLEFFFFFLNRESFLPEAAKCRNVEWIWIKLDFSFGILFKEKKKKTQTNKLAPRARAEAWKILSQKVDAL